MNTCCLRGAGNKVRTYDSIVSVGGDCYTALEDATGVPADEPAIGLLQFSTAAELKAGKAVRSTALGYLG
jgi:hypothetical protein